MKTPISNDDMCCVQGPLSWRVIRGNNRGLVFSGGLLAHGYLIRVIFAGAANQTFLTWFISGGRIINTQLTISPGFIFADEVVAFIPATYACSFISVGAAAPEEIVLTGPVLTEFPLGTLNRRKAFSAVAADMAFTASALVILSTGFTVG